MNSNRKNEPDRIVSTTDEAARGPGFLDVIDEKNLPIADDDRRDRGLMAICAVLATLVSLSCFDRLLVFTLFRIIGL